MSGATELAFHHRFVPASDPGAAALLLLHGTGGSEDDLLPLGRAVSPGAALLSPRGAVLEHGMSRFFRRLAEGVFDEDDLRRRTADLAAFVTAARAEHGLAAPVALGFSNGANIATALLMLHPGVLRGAILLRGMVPFAEPPRLVLPRTQVLLLSGRADPIAVPENAERLAAQLRATGAAVTHKVLSAGHELTQADVLAASTWLKETIQ